MNGQQRNTYLLANIGSLFWKASNEAFWELAFFNLEFLKAIDKKILKEIRHYNILKSWTI